MKSLLLSAILGLFALVANATVAASAESKNAKPEFKLVFQNADLVSSATSTWISAAEGGIIIQGDSLKGEKEGTVWINFFIRDYQGPQKYTLRDKSSGFWATFVTSTTTWERRTVSKGGDVAFVEITQDKDGLVSGVYEVTVYSDGKWEADTGISVRGTFSNLPKMIARRR